MGDLTKILNETMAKIDDEIVPLESSDIDAFRTLLRQALDQAYVIGTKKYIVRPERRSGRDRRMRKQ